jgi:uncharacterized protein
MKNYKISCDLFQLEYKDENKIFYAPKLGFSFVANKDLQNLIGLISQKQISTFSDKQIKVLDYLENKGVFNQNIERKVDNPVPKEFKPLRLTLFPTNRCNLRCIYCYASAGDFKPQIIDWNYVKTSIDFVIKNLIESKVKTFKLGFHGGGEPLFEWDLIKRIVAYAKEKCEENNLELIVDSATNGMLSKTQLDYIIENFISLNISFDGNEFAQNFHRPLPNGQGSFEIVNKTIKYLDSKDFKYGIRSTVSSATIDYMEDCLRFIIENYKCKHIHFEPIANTGRCLTNTELSVDLRHFSEKFAKCEEIAKKAGVYFTYSGCRFDTLSNAFCGVSCDNFAVTPDGYIASCFEVTSKEDPRSEKLFIGHINSNGEIKIDKEKRSYINSIRVDNLEFCNDCYARWHCGGECITKLGHDDYKGPRGNERCQLNRELIKKNIIKFIEFDQCGS